jgi:ribonuclease BN (tRNA processing enzyme)
VESEDCRLLIDVGHGVVSRLLQHVDIYSLNGLILSHLHPDHVADFPALRLALEWSCFPPAPWAGKLPVLAPPGAATHLRCLDPQHAATDRMLAQFSIAEIVEGAPRSFCGFDVRFARTNHPLEAYAVRVERGGAAVAFTSDTAPSAAVADLARGAGLLVADATWTTAAPETVQAAGHMTGALAAEMAREAGVGRLLLSHFFPTTDPAATLAAALDVFADSAVAQPFESVPVPRLG